MDTETRQEDAKLYTERGNRNERIENEGHKRRAARYEEKARQLKKKIIVECMKEIEKRRESEEKSKWKKKRGRMLEEADMAKEYLNKQRVEGQEEIAQKITERIEEQRKEERKRKTEESRYNDTYKKIKTEEMVKYLKGKKGMKDRSRIGRYRCGSEMRGEHYWKEETEGECRICGKGQESLKHVLKECEATKDKITMKNS